ncbi:unnamed protein product [Meloidogyne enterolobii]|uniref:Uncharacterized protein n=1 Tax=Meloidogyne enterolobii TaxID=390850 RepID=A0ACB0XM87_MELEN
MRYKFLLQRPRSTKVERRRLQQIMHDGLNLPYSLRFKFLFFNLPSSFFPRLYHSYLLSHSSSSFFLYIHLFFILPFHPSFIFFILDLHFRPLSSFILLLSFADSPYPQIYSSSILLFKIILQNFCYICLSHFFNF